MFRIKHKKRNTLYPLTFAFGLLLFALIPFLGNKANAAACIDKTPVPSNILVSGKEEDFCKTRGGLAATPGPGVCNDGTKVPDRDVANGSEEQYCNSRGGLPAAPAGPTETPKTIKSDCKGPNIEAGKPEGDENHCGILNYLVLFIKFLSGIVGVVVVAGIIIGGIQYSASGDDPSAVAAAKKRIANAIIALVVYIFMFAFLEYLIPGGVL